MTEMQESGIEWIGAIPASWKLYPAGGLFKEVKEKNYHLKYTNPLQFKYGSIVGKGTNAIIDESTRASLCNYTCVKPNMIMINGLNLNFDFVSQRVAIVKQTGIITSAYLALKPDESRVNPDFACYLLKGYDSLHVFHGMGSGVRKTLQWKDFKNLQFILPPKEIQERIVQIIDGVVSRIDSLIYNLSSQIDKLRLYKQSLIMEIVTSGLNPDAPMKDSEIEWLTKIPSHWKECRIKNVIFPMEKKTQHGDEIITCFRNGEVTLRKNRREEGYTFSETEHGYQGVDIGDLVIHGMDAFAGAIGCSDSRGKTTPVVHVCMTSGNNRYFMYYLRSLAYGNILMDLSNGVRQRSSDYRNFSRLSIFGALVPPIEEQDEIANFLDLRCQKIDSLANIILTKIEKLERYKNSIIYEYVTGKKEVV